MEKDYVILNIEKEYPGYTGTEKWLIITDLSEEEFAAYIRNSTHTGTRL